MDPLVIINILKRWTTSKSCSNLI